MAALLEKEKRDKEESQRRRLQALDAEHTNGLDTSFSSLVLGAYGAAGHDPRPDLDHSTRGEMLAEAALEGDRDKVEKMLAAGYDLESHDGTGLTALSEACCKGDLAMVPGL